MSCIAVFSQKGVFRDAMMYVKADDESILPYGEDIQR